MKKVLLSLLVVFASLALFAVEPVFDVSGTAGFEFKIDESALDIEQVLDPDLSIDVSFTTTLPATLTAGFTFSPVTTESTPVYDTEGATTDVITSVEPGLSLDFVQYEEEAWLLRFEPNVIGLSTYTINGDFTDAEGALKLGLTDYGVNLVLADRVAGEVTEHATEDIALAEGWIFGASYDLDVSGVKGLVAGAYKFEDATNNRVTIEGEVTEVPEAWGKLSADLVFGFLNYGDDTTDDSTSAYRVDLAYEYPYEMEPITVTPHVGLTWQDNLELVYEEEVANDEDGDVSWADTQEVTAGVDLSYLATPITVELTDTFTIDMLEEDPVYLLDLTPSVEYAISDKSSAGVEVPVSFLDLTNEGTITVEPHGYVEYAVPDTKVTLAGDVYYFYDNKDESEDNKLAYMGEVTYNFSENVSAGAHLGNEVWDDDEEEVIGANELADLHWYLYLKAEFEF
ncbi:hypothetical protein X927_04860 [Petrotoga mexicana DSM 14811]|uniref:Uncharacterized protein n=1 Tax=Petrotoga mexicana DSM 14811 TaxID=1122954 RepID=A0A2K1PAI0_9BACT|nr:hypothetical protein [Petrotoga mexicana]PNR99804.1 hypothetical protein X927_04860 [Petrotoga mexicana DSM 14811]